MQHTPCLDLDVRTGPSCNFPFPSLSQDLFLVFVIFRIYRLRAMRGAFIVLEGLDRSGKSTQASMLCDSLKAQGRKVSLWKYPARETFLGKYDGQPLTP